MANSLMLLILGAISCAGGMNLAMMAMEGNNAAMWLTAFGAIGSGLACMIGSFERVDTGNE
jgi:hypothetical protein